MRPELTRNNISARRLETLMVLVDASLEPQYYQPYQIARI